MLTLLKPLSSGASEGRRSRTHAPHPTPHVLHWCRYYEDLKEENKRYPGQAPFPWLEAQFKQLGLDVYREVPLAPNPI